MTVRMLLAAAALACLLVFTTAVEFELSNVCDVLDPPNPTYLRAGSKYKSVDVQGGLPLGNKTTYRSIFIWRNGIVTFESESLDADLGNPTLNFSSIPVNNFVAPLWFPEVSPSLVSSEVWWEAETADSPREGSSREDVILPFAEDVVNEFGQSKGIELNFSPTWAIVISWSLDLVPDDRDSICNSYTNCSCEALRDDGTMENGYSCDDQGMQCLKDLGYTSNDIKFLHNLCDLLGISNSDLDTVEYQLVLTTDEVETYAIYLYQCRQQFLSVRYDAFAFVGNDSVTGHHVGSLSDNYTDCLPPEDDGIARFLFRCIENSYCNDFYRVVWNNARITGLSSYVRSLTNSFSQYNYRNLQKGYDFIPFLLVDSDPVLDYVQFNNTNQTSNTSNTTVALSRGQYRSNTIFHPGIRVGTQTHTKIYVNTNGLISFGNSFYFWYPELFPSRYYWVRESYVVAPFWMEYDTRTEGNVFYSTVHSQDTINMVNTFLSNQTGMDFRADSVLIAAWVDVPIYPHYYVLHYPQYYTANDRDRVLNNKNTFEAIIATSGDTTYAIFTYECGRLNNGGFYRGPVIGFNAGGHIFDNSYVSTQLTANRIACANQPSSEYFNLIYKLNAGEDLILKSRGECLRMLDDDEKLVSDDEIELYKEMISPCPCTIRNAWRDRNYLHDRENFYCYYRAFTNPNTTDYDQYCCYSFRSGTWGSLETSGYRMSGLAKIEPGRYGRRTLAKSDVELRRVCCGLAGLCDEYIKRRPADDCSGYIPPVRTWGWGDPHITTLDGHSYTFNGIGDFVMFNYRSGAVEFHARMKEAAERATQFSAFAIGSVSSDYSVEIHCDPPMSFCTTLYKGIDISQNLTSINDTLSKDRVIITRESQSTVTVLLNDGIALAVSYEPSIGIPNFQLNLDPSLSGSMHGLLGNRDGDSSNDFVRPNGSVLSSTATEQEIYNYGNEWRLTEVGKSLFTYKDGEGPETFHDPSWNPLFSDDVNSMASDEVKMACTPPGSAQPLEQCLFDAVATNNITIGMATTDTLNDNIKEMEESNNMPPTITSGSTGPARVSLTTPLTISLTVSDDKDSSPTVSLLSPAPPGSSLSPSSSSNTFTFSWTLPELDPQQNISDVVIVASDSSGFISTYFPVIEVCACLNDGVCTTDGTTSSTNIILLNCICPPAWEGRYCETDVDGCLDNGCSQGVECMDVPAPGEGAECGPCPPGFTADGNRCADINECAADALPCQQICTNTEGSYECSCYLGYVLDDNDPSRCSDYNECTLMTDDCDQQCTNTDGSYSCTCDRGFTINNDYYCLPEVECNHPNNCGSAQCANISGSPTCYCNKGFQLDSTNDCVDIDECSTGVCEQTCTNIPGSFLCGCNDGFQLEIDRVSCFDVDDCKLALDREQVLCEEQYSCYNTEDGSFSCLCPPGLYPITERNSSSSTDCGIKDLVPQFIEQSVRITFYSLTEDELFDGGKLHMLYTLLLPAVTKYCSPSDICEIIPQEDSEITKRDSDSYYTENDLVQPVFNITGVESGPDTVSITFYILINDYWVLNGNDTINALNATEIGIALGVEIDFSLVVPNPTTGQPPVTQDGGDDSNIALIAGIAAGAAVIAVIVSSGLALTLFVCVEWHRKKKNSQADKKALLTEGLSWPDGKGGGEREMTEVPPQGPRMSEDHGRTIFVNENL